MPPTPTSFEFSDHSRKRASERGITDEEFLLTVTQPDKKIRQWKTQRGGFTYRLEKNFDKGVLVIIADIWKNDCIFITGYWQ